MNVSKWLEDGPQNIGEEPFIPDNDPASSARRQKTLGAAKSKFPAAVWSLGLLLLSLADFGCAGVKVYRVPSPDGSDPKREKEANAIEGFRYYLGRPYVAVKKPFPLYGDDYYIKGKITLFSGTVVVNEIDTSGLPEDVKKRFPGNAIKGSDISASASRTPGTYGDAQHAGKAKSPGTNSPATPSTGTATADTSTQTGNDASQGGDPSSSKATSSSDPVLKLNDLYDIVMLPDFDEQYAIQVKRGAGKTTSNFAFRDGWMLESAALSVDNTQLTKGIFDTIGKLIDLGGTIGKNVVAPGSTLAQAATGNAQQAGLEGTPVVLRVRKFKEVQPGLYPLLKRREAAEAAMDDQHLARPNFPFTVVPFNISETVIVELVSPLPTVRNATGNEDTKKTSLSKPQLDAVKQWLTGTKVALPPDSEKVAIDYLGGADKVELASAEITTSHILTIYVKSEIPATTDLQALNKQLSAKVTSDPPGAFAQFPNFPVLGVSVSKQ
jgi:hypothetical protein